LPTGPRQHAKRFLSGTGSFNIFRWGGRKSNRGNFQKAIAKKKPEIGRGEGRWRGGSLGKGSEEAIDDALRNYPMNGGTATVAQVLCFFSHGMRGRRGGPGPTHEKCSPSLFLFYSSATVAFAWGVSLCFWGPQQKARLAHQPGF